MTANLPTLIRDPWRRLWHFFTGDGFLAAVLILCAALLLMAALLPQTPVNDLVAYSRWLSEAQTRLGNLFEALNTLGLFSITASPAFRLALAALGWCAALRLSDQLDRLRRADHTARRSHLAAIMVYVGTLAALLGLVLGAFIDYRVDNIVVLPNTVTNIPGTSFTVRLDAMEDQRAQIALLSQTETVAQGSIGEKQPLYDGVAIYLDRIGPALRVSATRGATQTLDLQNTATSPLQKHVLLPFTSDQNEGFLAAPEVNLVLRVQPLEDGRFTAQIYQSATGKDFGNQPFEPGGSISIEGVTFTFEPAAYIVISLANQPSHWVIALGLVITLLGLVGLLIWPGTTAATRLERVALSIARVSWPLVTALFVGLVISVYPRTASLGSGARLDALEMSLAAWLLASGSVLTRKASRMVLLVLAIISALLAIWLLIAARA
jgi:putative component of toxin-antitoxin plasmid stabilization module